MFLVDSQIRQILDWSGEPELALQDFNEFLQKYRDLSGQEFDLEPVNAKRLLSIFGNSHFLTHFLFRHPLEADKVVESNCIETDKKIEDYREDLSPLIAQIKNLDLPHFGKKIRHYKYQEYLRITAKDLSQAAGMESILSEISDLAIAITEVSYQYFYEKLCEQYGIPIAKESEKHPCGFSVIAQGKLGGRELNYSSDIDLQLVYETNQGGLDRSDLSNHEFFTKLSEQLLRFMSEKSEDGFLYRVDMNLRPEGKNGSLANSLLGIEQYYETFGEEWERQALIKAFPVAGNPETGKQFLEIVAPFVWRKSFDLSSIEKLKEMKKKVHTSIKKTAPQGYNVKLGMGGIREIEYFVQILQLLYGGRHLELRTQSTLEPLQRLENLNLLSNREASQLKDAYLFLRRVEHLLQMVNEAQTHTIPLDLQHQKALARRMGYFEEDAEEAQQRFLNDLTHYTNFVESTFKGLFDKEVV